ncbi:MAG: UbiD family decarboxylase [Desulfatiglandales bacterium]|jgi:4-hydroxy-3-polyprenylbenzoate decarboxylase|nr:UbiD family decarboxylase [Desulfatiglandales bacterium]
MGYKDLRKWLEEVEGLNQIKKIEDVDWDLEMGAITELIYHKGSGIPPAVLFGKIPGYPEEFRTLSGMTRSLERIAFSHGPPGEERQGPSPCRSR